MTDARVIKATYADWKPVKTRASLQIILEVPIEDTEKVMKMLGVPIPGQEKWVAVALLDKSVSGAAQPTVTTTDVTPSKPESGGKKWHEMSRAQQAGILCADPKFQRWALRKDEAGAAEFVRTRSGVNSRADLDQPGSAEAFDAMVSAYRRDTGQMAEVR